MKVSILNAGEQTDYLFGLISGLSEIPALEIEVVDSDSAVGVVDHFPRVTLLNLRGDNISAQSFLTKIFLITRYYFRLLIYTIRTSSKLFHIQWEKNGIAFFDRTLLILYYKLLGKRIVFTSHNIYKEARDGQATHLRWLSLKIMYALVDRIIVHTSKMSDELLTIFGVPRDKVVVIPHGINNRISRTGISRDAARQNLNIDSTAHVVLFFGQVDAYKGIETLIDAVDDLRKDDPTILLIIAGKPKRHSNYATNLQLQAEEFLPKNNQRFCFHYIPVDEVESYFIAADCLVLPYKKIFQSGVIFLAYRFGLPIIATDVGSFREDILDGQTGYICKPDDAGDLAKKLRLYFSSDLFFHQVQIRKQIIELGERKYSWKDISRKTYDLYTEILTDV